MAFSERFAFLISVNGQDAIRGFQRIGDAAERNLGKADNRLDKFGARATQVGAGMLAFAGVGATALNTFAQGASDLAESQSKVNVVFGESAQEVQAWARGSATAFGQSTQQALEAAGTYGNLFQAFGIGREQATTMSKSLVQLAADLASFNNTSVDDAILALRSGLSGETEPLKRYGVALNEARLKTEAMSLGLISSTKDALTPAAKAQAAYSLILKDTTLAQGDFARTSGGLANQQRILAAEMKNVRDNIGMGVTPVMLNLLKPVNALASGFNGLGSSTQNAIGKIAAIGTAGVGAVGGLSLLAGQVTKLRDRFKPMNDEGVRAYNTLGKFAATAGVVAGVASVGFALYEVAKAARQVQVDVAGAMKLTSRELAEAFLGFEAFREGTGFDAFEKIAAGSLPTAQRMRDELKAMGVDVTRLDEILKDEAAAQRRATADADAGADAFAGVGGAAGFAADQVNEYDRALEGSLGAHLDLDDAAGNLADTEERVRDSLDGVGEAAGGATADILTYQEALDDALGTALAADDAHSRAAAAVEGLRDAFEEAGLASEDASDFMDRYYNGAADGAEDAGRAIDDATRAAVAAAQDEVDAMAESGEIADTAEARKAALLERLEELKTEFPAVAGQIDKYIAKVKSVSSNLPTAEDKTRRLSKAKQDLEQDTRDLIRAAQDEVDAMKFSGSEADVARQKHENLLAILTDLKARFPELATIIDRYITDVINAWHRYLEQTDPSYRREAAQGRNRGPGNPQPGDAPVNPTAKTGVTVINNISGDGLNSREVADLTTKRTKRALVGTRTA